MTYCCGQSRSGRFCSECGKSLDIQAPALSLLTHLEKEEKHLREHGEKQDQWSKQFAVSGHHDVRSSRFRKLAERNICKANQRNEWIQALRFMIARAEESQ